MQRQVQLKEPIQLAEDGLIQLDKDGPIQLDKDGPIQLSEDHKTLSMTGPVKLGTQEWKVLKKFLDARINEIVENVSGTLKAALLENGEVWVLPYRFSGKEKTKHSIAAMGEPCVWAGEVDIVGGKVTQLKGDSGHYKTYNSDPEKQRAIFQFAVSAFRDQNYDTSGLEDVSVMGLRHANQTKNELEDKPSSE